MERSHLLHLWQQAQTGDKVAFCRLAELQYRSMFRYATNFTSDTDHTIQDVFIDIWEKRQVSTIQYVVVYLFKSLRNQFLQEFRRNKPSLSSLEADDLGELSDWQTLEVNITQEESGDQPIISVAGPSGEGADSALDCSTRQYGIATSIALVLDVLGWHAFSQLDARPEITPTYGALTKQVTSPWPIIGNTTDKSMAIRLPHSLSQNRRGVGGERR